MRQRGALFGLDARLALAIFGVLATITGFVAFGRLETARTSVVVADLQNFEKAFQHYQADLGTFFLFTLNKAPDDTESANDITALWDEAMVKPGFRPRWNGPYLDREHRRSREHGSWSVFYAQADRQNYCTTDSECAIWLTLSAVPADLWEELNRLLDEGGGKFPETKGQELSSGRLQADAATNPRALFYRIDGRPKQ